MLCVVDEERKRYASVRRAVVMMSSSPVDASIAIQRHMNYEVIEECVRSTTVVRVTRR